MQEDILRKLEQAVNSLPDAQKKMYAGRIIDASVTALDNASGRGRDVQLLAAALAAASEASFVALEQTLLAVSVVLAEYLEGTLPPTEGVMPQ